MKRESGHLFLGVSAVLRHELRLLFFAPLTYLFQAAFLLAVNAFVFLVANFYGSDEATLRLLLVFLPWVSLVLVPALSMAAWTDSHTSREIELLYSLPVSPMAVVLGKFAAGYLLLLLTLFMTLPFAFTVAYLGEPDKGVMLASYLAAALFLGASFAVTLFAGTFVREPVGAFVTGAGALFVLMLCGWDVFGRLVSDLLPQWAWETLVVYSPLTWSQVVGQGLIPVQALIYFLLTIAGSLLLAHWVMGERRRGGLRGLLRADRLSAFAAVMLVWLAGIPLSERIPGQIDLTEEQEFTLHAGTREVLERLPEDTMLTLYWSATEDTVPASIKSHARRTQSLIREMTKVSALDWKVVDPEPDSESEIQALSQRIHKVPMSSGDHFFLGLTVEQGGRIGRMPYLDIRRESLLEYDLVQALNGLSRQSTPKIAIVSPLLPSSAALAEREGLSFMAELKRAYDVAVVPFFKTEIPSGIDVVILMGADILHEDMLYSIDQFVMAGGSLIVMIDPFSRVKRANNVTNPSPSDEINDISDLLARYGIVYEGAAVVGDAQLASIVSDGDQGRLNYPYWMRITASDLSAHHATTANLNEVLLVEPGAFRLEGAAKALVTTTESAGSALRSDFEQLTPRDLSMSFASESEKRVLAATVQGPLRSAFGSVPDLSTPVGHRSDSVGVPLIFAIADVDWLFDPFSLQKSNLGQDTVVRPLNDNLAFMLNMLEFATGDDQLLAIRSRGQLHRPFSRVADLFQTAQAKAQEREAVLAQQVGELEQQITAATQGAGDVSFEDLPESVTSKLKEFESALLSARRELRAVRHSIRAEVDRLGRQLTFLNLLAGPLQVGVLGACVFGYRRRHMARPTTGHHPAQLG